MAQKKITLVKTFTYRGAPEEFSNSYSVIVTTAPATSAAAKVFVDALIAAEQPTIQNTVKFARAYWYNDGDANATYTFDYEHTTGLVPGTASSGLGGVAVPGDIAATIRWDTGRTNSRGKKIYLRKYMHGIRGDDGTDVNKLLVAQAALFATWAGKLIDGTLTGGLKLVGPDGAVPTSPAVATYLTTRTLKRRGKRPPT